MPLKIVKRDITKINCDAIVNITDHTLISGGKLFDAIHKAAGPEMLDECKAYLSNYGVCKTGDIKITDGYNLKCKNVIHVSGPVIDHWLYTGGEDLSICYKHAFYAANLYGYKSVAIPLISQFMNPPKFTTNNERENEYALADLQWIYNTKRLLEIAIKEIGLFLQNHYDIMVYLVLQNKVDHSNYSELYEKLSFYLEDNYEGIDWQQPCYPIVAMSIKRVFSEEAPALSPREKRRTAIRYDYKAPKKLSEIDKSDLANLIEHLDDNFAITLLKLIDLKGMTDQECYKKANVSKQTFSKIMNKQDYRPSKNTVLAFAIALKLDLVETNALLATVGFTLSSSSKFDMVIQGCINLGVYDINEINLALFEFDLPLLGFN